MRVTPYDYHRGYYTITVQIVPDDVHTVRCAIWQEEDQSDLIWYEASTSQMIRIL
ncbi:MAG: GBS Bsp-like repeat-containing protein [Fusicatenibacter saccharivorans]